ncbi:hydroxyacylglutathione hydrolase [Dryocola clanedunensis]|uniref:hydroxyacylglutathione hydrolase n=1 Tax=Cedecea sulfonylureivorans TaxID=3051154 RepID=UPI0019294D8D|nr:hydroxyacylglutathione hydrolase [Cedecea sulfonylureivorans]
MNLNSIPAFQDNYIWVLNDEAGKCIIVDPGEAAPVLNAIAKNNWQPEAILLTHHHHDHVGGVKELLQTFPGLVVYGPEETQDKGTNRVVREGDKVNILECEFSVIATPGHTLGHLCYFSFPYLFCGDTLFSGGCGRLFEGTPKQMYESFQKLNKLPQETLVCCAHEYTESNIKFALSILPEDQVLIRYYREVKELRLKNHATLPTTLQIERGINLFLRTEDADLKDIIQKETSLQQPEQVFAWLRAKKDSF